MTVHNTNRSSSKPWYRFFDGNRKYDYKSLFNAIHWAERKVADSTSHEIRILRVCKRGRALEVENVARVFYNRPKAIKKVVHYTPDILKAQDYLQEINEADKEIALLKSAPENETMLKNVPGSITTVWRNQRFHYEYKEKEKWVSSQESKS